MRDLLKLFSVLMAIAMLSIACSSDGDSDSSDKEDMDPDEARVAAARAAWPEYTGEPDETIDLSSYTVLTLIPFENLTDNSQEDDAGEEFVQEVKEYVEDRYEGKFSDVRVADAPLGQADEVVLRGQVYDFSSGAGWNPWTGRNQAKFKAEFVLENGQSGEVLKSARLKEAGYSDNDEMLEAAARDTAKMLGRSKD